MSNQQKLKKGDIITPEYVYDFSLDFKQNKAYFLEFSKKEINNLKYKKVGYKIEFNKNTHTFFLEVRKDEYTKPITTTIPLKTRAEMRVDPFMKDCIYLTKGAPNNECHNDPKRNGYPEWEHAFIHDGNKIQERWAIVPCCTNHNRGPSMVKDYNRYRALKRVVDGDVEVTMDDLTFKYPKIDWWQEWRHLEIKFKI